MSIVITNKPNSRNTMSETFERLLFQENYVSLAQQFFAGVYRSIETRKTKYRYQLANSRGNKIDELAKQQNEVSTITLHIQNKDIPFVQLINRPLINKEDYGVWKEEGNISSFQAKLLRDSAVQHFRVADQIYIQGGFNENGVIKNPNALLLNPDVKQISDFTYTAGTTKNEAVYEVLTTLMSSVEDATGSTPDQVMMSSKVYNWLVSLGAKEVVGTAPLDLFSKSYGINFPNGMIRTSALDEADGGWIVVGAENVNHYELIHGLLPTIDTSTGDWVADDMNRGYFVDVISSVGNLLIYIKGSIAKIRVILK